MRIALHIQIELCSLRLLSKTESKIIASEFGRKVYGPIVRDIVCAQEAPKIVREENEQEALIYLAFAELRWHLDVPDPVMPTKEEMERKYKRQARYEREKERRYL